MVKDPILKPRIETVPETVSQEARALFAGALVWDNLLPWLPGANLEHVDVLLPRFRKVGVDFISLTIAASLPPGNSLFRMIGRLRREFRERGDQVALASSVAEIRRAKADGKLALGFNFQNTLPFEDSLDLVQVYYDLGVRQCVLAYNQKNLVGDGGAERTDAGLSRFGIAVVKEMNRVGMLVDGSHSGYRTTMEAMEISEQPFIFSHSNPYAVRPHYRSIKDDQIKACVATGGVIGINGVGYWVGDNDAPTEAIFRCLDYVVQMVGPSHVGLGFDYIYDLDALIGWVRAAPHMWPPYKGEEMVRHNYAGPEQMAELTDMMLAHGYGGEAVRDILGENWARLCERVWK
jgi:membrane dipeptidase